MSDDLSLAIGDRGAASFLLAFVVTQLVEVPIYVWALGGVHEQRRTQGGAPPPKSVSWPLRVGIAFGASAITHPFVWFVWPWAAMVLYRTALHAGGPALSETGRTLLYGALAEGSAVLVEALYLRGFRVRRALAWSLFANAASVLVGTLVVRIL